MIDAAIIDAFATATCDVVLITGGLGPTKDDITKEALCTFFNTQLVRHPGDRSADRGNVLREHGPPPKDPLEVNRAQADLPESCTVIPNDRGTASGMWFEKDGSVFVSMPGVPYEMKSDDVKRTSSPDWSTERFAPPTIIHRTVLTTGLGESALAQRIADWEDDLAADDIKLAYLPSPGLVKLRLSTYASNEDPIAPGFGWTARPKLYATDPEVDFGEGRGNDWSKWSAPCCRNEGADTFAGRKLHRRLPEPPRSHPYPGSSAYYIGGSGELYQLGENGGTRHSGRHA